MSVINQMLKDLEQRTPEQGATASQVILDKKPSTAKIVLIALLVLLTINALAFYIWDLKAQLSATERQRQQKVLVSADNTAEQDKAEQDKVEQNKAQQNNVIVASTGLNTEESESDTQSHVELSSSNLAYANPASSTLPSQLTAKVSEEQITEQIAAPLITSTEVLPSEQTYIASNHAHEVNNTKKIVSKVTEHKVTEHKVATNKSEPVELSLVSHPKSSMTVSRRQLSPVELVSQKLVSAEKAINSNNISKAESLFEEVLIIKPSHQLARKKLAALWFGRKSYQQAINLLSQGINLDKSDSDLRMLKAQIQLQQRQLSNAYNTLIPLAGLEQLDYQAMLANIAQQFEAYDSAITAYQLLIKMQPHLGKWPLGLAIVYDKNSQFSIAQQTYKKALSKNDLSRASTEFAQQRMQALGE